MRAVIYTRTSTNKQSTAMQLEPLQTLVERSGYELVEIIEDEGVSGTILGNNRNGMSRLMQMVNRKEIDVVCVYSVDRIGRKLTDVLSIAEQLNEKGVGLVIHKNGIDTTTTHGKHLLSFILCVNELDKVNPNLPDVMLIVSKHRILPSLFYETHKQWLGERSFFTVKTEVS